MLVVISSDCLSRCLNLCFASYNIACIVKFTERQTLQLRRIPISSPTGFVKVMKNQEFHSSRPGKSWNLIVGPQKSQLKIKVLLDRLIGSITSRRSSSLIDQLLQVTRQEQCKIKRSNYQSLKSAELFLKGPKIP